MGGWDGVTLLHDNQIDTNQLWPSLSSCMRQRFMCPVKLYEQQFEKMQ